MLYPTVPTGPAAYPTTGWTSNWDNGVARTIKVMGGSGRVKEHFDPQDSRADFHCHSFEEEGNWMTVDGKGVCKIMGPHPRLHIHRPNSSSTPQEWLNTEMTCYCYVPSTGAFMSGYTPPGSSTFQKATYSMFDLRTRSNHHLDHLCRCNGLSYISTINTMKSFGGFRKEIIHGYYANSSNTSFTMPKDKWFGQKFICRNYNNNTNVKLEKYLDLQNNNVWVKHGEKLDTGSWAVTAGADLDGCNKYAPGCTSGCVDKRPPGPPYNKKVLRAGRGVYLRADFTKDVRFSKFSARPIAALP